MDMAELEQLLAILAPSFAGDPRLPGALALAITRVAPGHCFRSQVIALLVAHMLQTADIAALGGGGGAITSMKEGGLSITYSDSKDIGGTGFTSTRYGQEIQRLNHLCYGMTATTGWV